MKKVEPKIPLLMLKAEPLRNPYSYAWPQRKIAPNEMVMRIDAMTPSRRFRSRGECPRWSVTLLKSRMKEVTAGARISKCGIPSGGHVVGRKRAQMRAAKNEQ